MRTVLCLLFIGLAAARLSAEEPLINAPHSRTMSLDGQWRYIVDPYENGYYDYRREPIPNGFFMNQKPKSKADRVEYDFDRSDTLAVPGDWNTQRRELFFYEGTVWYKKSFDYPHREGTRLFLRFGAANYTAIVWLNGEKLGEHTGGFTPFAFEVTGRVRERGNFIVVKVDNRRCMECVPTVITDWWNYGGLTRSVTLLETPGTFVADYAVRLKGEGTVAGWARLDGPERRGRVEVAIPEAGARTTVETGEDGIARFALGARVARWSPSHPRLYTITIVAGGDTVTEKVGFRTIETRGTKILLNGKPVFLKGICIHEEAPFRSGRACTREDALTLLGWAKELGCNFVRLAHYPHNDLMTRMADSLGLMVWSEVPVYWTIQWENPAAFDCASQQLHEMIARDRNRASVVLWSVANETPLGQARLDFLRRLLAQARREDSTRLLTAAMERRFVAPSTEVIDDPLGQYVDVLGCNEYLGWYDGPPEKADSMQWKVAYDKPLIMSELGAEAPAGNHADSLTVWSEEYQARVYRHQVRMLGRIPSLSGMSPWILMDFRSPRRQLPGIQDFYNRKGLISDKGVRKEAFGVLQEFYRSLPETP
jgi:beta-glucuronidase